MKFFVSVAVCSYQPDDNISRVKMMVSNPIIIIFAIIVENHTRGLDID